MADCAFGLLPAAEVAQGGGTGGEEDVIVGIPKDFSFGQGSCGIAARSEERTEDGDNREVAGSMDWACRSRFSARRYWLASRA